MIRTERTVAAPADTVDRLLRDIEAWRLWAPHIAWVEPPRGIVDAGWVGRVKPRLGPTTTMRVTWSEPGQGMRWESPGAGHLLRYENLVEALGPDTSRLVFTARVDGPAGPLLTACSRPLSAGGQRRRTERLAALAELTARRPPTL